jgi:hypothetical protein
VIVASASTADVLARPTLARAVWKLGDGLGDVADATREGRAGAKLHLDRTALLRCARDPDRQRCRELPIATLPRGLLVVAVGAAHFAFRDLGFDALQTGPGRDHH